MLAHRNLHIYTIWICLSLLFLFLFSSLHRVFFFFHLQETAYEILIMMHYQDYVLGLLRSPCVFTCVPFSGLLFCLLMTTVFQTFCPFSLYSCLSLPSLPLSTSNLVPHPSVTSSLLPFLRCPTAHADSNTSLEHRLPFVSANQIFPKLSSLSCLSLFSLCVRDYVVMRVSCL